MQVLFRRVYLTSCYSLFSSVKIVCKHFVTFRGERCVIIRQWRLWPEHQLMYTESGVCNPSGLYFLPAKGRNDHTTYLIQRPCYHWGSPSQDPAGIWTTRRPPGHREETQTAVVWSCLPFIGSSKNHFARHSEREKKARQTEKEVGRQHQGMNRCGVRTVPEGSGEQENGGNCL